MSRFFQRSNSVVSFGVILSVGFAHALPSQRFDDYDQERYERLVSDSRSAMEAADADLSRIESDRANAENDLRRKESEIRSLDEQARRISADANAADNELRQLEATVPQYRSNILVGERQVQRLSNEVAAARQLAEREERARQPSLNRVNQAKAQLDQLQNQAQALQQRVRQAETEAARAEQKAQELEKKMNEFRQGVVNYANVVEVRKGEINQATQNIKDIVVQKEAWLKENAHYQPEWDALQPREPVIREEIRNLDREIAELEGAGNAIGAQNKKDERNRKNAELNHVHYRQEEIKNLWVRNNQAIERSDRTILAQEQKIRDLHANIRTLQESGVFYDQEANKLAPQVAEAKRLASQERAQVSLAEAAMAPVREQIRAQEGVMAAAQRDYDAANTQYLIADRDLRRQQKELEGIASVLEQNRQGLQSTLIRTRDLIRMINDAKIAVQRIDQDIATLQAQSQSLAQRLASADQALTNSSARLRTATTRVQEMENARAQVLRNLSDAQIEIAAIARSHGEADGDKEGAEVGTEKGNAEGLAQGKVSGLEEALKAGREAGELARNDATALAQGLSTGKAEGLQRAMSDASSFEKIGFDQKEKEFLSAKLKELDLANGFRGLQQSRANRSENGDGRYYKPRPSTYPHPKLGSFYTLAYDSAYRSSLSTAYAEVFSATYTKVFARTVDQYRTDKVKYAEGFKIGNREASLLKGLEEGRASGYRDNIEKEKISATNKGTLRANAKYAEPVIQIISARLKEVSQDGVLAPGEEAIVELQVKNVGFKDKVGLRGLMSVTSKGVSVPTAEMALPPIPAQSMVTIRMAQKLLVGPSTSVGAQFAAQFRVNDGATTMMTESFSGAVQTPAQLAIRQAPRILVPGTPGSIEVSISNITNREQTVTVQIGNQASQVQVAQNTQSVKIPSGGLGSLKFEISGVESALFEEALVSVIATQNGAKISEPTQLKMVIGRQFQLRSSSQGLIVGANLSSIEAKTLRTSMNLDVYDTRVNGALNSVSTISGYGTKPIHVAVEDSVEILDTNTVKTLLAHLNQGGIVVVWGDVTAIDALAKISGVARVREVKSTQAQGTDILEGIVISGMNANSEILTLSGNATGILAAGSDVIGSLALTNEFSDQPGRIVALGIQPSALSNAQMTKVTQLIESSGASFTAKMAQAQKSIDAVKLVALDMLAEIRSDDARTDVRWMGGDKKKDGKIMKVVKNLLKNQKEIARHYPILRQTVEVMKDAKDKADGLKLLHDEKTGAFGDSIQKVFCKNFKAEDRWSYCK